MAHKIKNEGKLANGSSAPMIQKQKKKRSIFNQHFISNGEDASEKFNQVSKGKNVVESSNDNTDQMDVDQLVEDVQKLVFPSNLQPLRCSICCCYDGLVVIEVPDNLDAKRSTFLLWNPSIRESMVLPTLELPLDADSRFGLGYDSTSGDYKILHIHEDLGDCKLPNEILALKGGSWRRVDKHPRGINSLVSAMQCLVFIHAAFHWIGISRNYFVVVSFSISNEVYSEIPLPEEMLSLKGNILSDDATIGISVLEGMICLYSNSFCPLKGTIKLWVLKEYGVKESWIPLSTIEDPLIFNAVPKYRFADGEVLFGCWLLQGSGTAFRTLSGPFVSWPLCDIVQNGCVFTESLIFPKSLTY